MSSSIVERPPSIGTLAPVDQRLFTWFLERQERLDHRGDLLEVGARLGGGALIIGDHLRAAEKFTVSCTAADEGRDEFEKAYLRLHQKLPEIVNSPSAATLGDVEPDSCRFVHVDAADRYEHVRGDLKAARKVLREGGIVVCDTYRAETAPGAAAAMWEAVTKDGLRPICVTGQKLYGSWQAAGPIQHELLLWLAGRTDCWHEVQEVVGRPLVRIEDRSPQVPSESDAELAEIRAALELERARRRRAQLALAARKDQLEAVRGSVSFKVGRIFTATPRALRRVTRRDV